MKHLKNNPGQLPSLLAVIALFSLWVIAFSVFLSSRPVSITTIEQRLKPSAEYQLPLDLRKGDIFRQIFVANHDNLGQIAIRFQTHLRVNKDELIFRIKEAGSPDWDYQATYKTDQFQPEELFPFGFPQYSNSKGREYVWELESTSGNTVDYVSIGRTRPVSASRYQFNKSQMATDKRILASFLLYKSINILQGPDSLLNLILWGAPLIVYLIALYTPKNRPGLLRASAIPFIILVLDDLFVVTQYDTVTVFLFIFWVTIFLSYQPPRSYIAGLALFNLFLSLILQLLNMSKQSDKPFTWFILFLLIFAINDIYRNSEYFKLRTKTKKAKK